VRINGHRYDLSDRQGAAVLFGLVMLIPVSIGFGVILVLIAGWLSVIGIHPQRLVFGWLSDTSHRDANGQIIWNLGKVPIFYWFGIVNAYLLYQFVELTAAVFNRFKRALS
jgi:hypothetical protein